MEQRPLRLGDIVDDYCPRERRITNHAIVALVGDEIRQTRCATCDVEHVYKQARMPHRMTPRRVTPGGDAAPPEAAGGQAVLRAASAPQDDARPGPPDGGDEAPDQATQTSNGAEDGSADASQALDPKLSDDQRGIDGWLANRPLIRATLPRTNGDPPVPRPIPEFTMHQRQGAGGRPFRHGHGRPGSDAQPPNGFGSGGFGSDRHGNHAGPGGGRSRRRRGGRHKHSR